MSNTAHSFETLRADMHARYGHAFDSAVIDATLDQVIAKHTENATLLEFTPVLVEREVHEIFGAPRIHVRFAAGANHDLAQAAVQLTRKHAGTQLRVDAAVAHPENSDDSHLAHVLQERGMVEDQHNYLDNVRTVAMPDYIVYLGADLPRDEAGKDVKIWDIAQAQTVEETRELLDDLEARVLYMLGRMGMSPVTSADTTATKAV